jgi:hypothetical protein
MRKLVRFRRILMKPSFPVRLKIRAWELSVGRGVGFVPFPLRSPRQATGKNDQHNDSCVSPDSLLCNNLRERIQRDPSSIDRLAYSIV